MSYYNDENEFNFFKLFTYLGICVIIFAIIYVIIFGFMPSYSEGDRSGSIYKISKKGLIFKSYEGEMNVGGMASDANGQVVPNKFQFSITDKSLIDKFQKASKNGNRVTLTYTEYLIKPIMIDTSYVINSIESIKEK
jgi:hypothetical protein